MLKNGRFERDRINGYDEVKMKDNIEEAKKSMRGNYKEGENVNAGSTEQGRSATRFNTLKPSSVS